MLYSWKLDYWSIASVTKQGLLFLSGTECTTIPSYCFVRYHTATTLEITAAVTSIIAFVVGTLAGVLVYHCLSKHRSRLTTVLSSHHQQKADLEYDYVTSGVGNKLRRNVACDTVQRIELKANVAYKPAEHWFALSYWWTHSTPFSCM